MLTVTRGSDNGASQPIRQVELVRQPVVNAAACPGRRAEEAGLSQDHRVLRQSSRWDERSSVVGCQRSWQQQIQCKEEHSPD